jgi:purine-cytosine permease-like protein
MAADQNAGESSPPAGPDGGVGDASARDAADSDAYDDDALANALADENLRLTLTGSIKLTDIFPAASVDESEQPEPVQSEPDAPAEPAAEPAAEVTDFSAFAAPSGPAFDLPAPPRRTALGNRDLIQNLDVDAHDTTTRLGVMKQLEEQMRLREEQSREFEQWEQRMLAIGTPDAIRYVEQTKGDFQGLAVPPGLAPSSAEEVAANEAAEAQLAVAETEIPLAPPATIPPAIIRSATVSPGSAAPPTEGPVAAAHRQTESPLRSRRAARRAEPVIEQIELPAAWASIVPSAADYRTDTTPPAPAPEPPVVESPVADSPRAGSSVADSPVADSLVVEAPVAETPAGETPAAETPVVETPAAETPVVETSAVENPAAETPAVETPAVETSRPLLPDLSSFPPPTTAPFSFDSLISGELAIAAGALPTEDPGVFTPFPHYGYPDENKKPGADDGSADDLAGDDLPDDYLPDDYQPGDYQPGDRERDPAASWLSAGAVIGAGADSALGTGRRSILSLEAAGLEPTPLDERVAKGARLFWLWFAANSSIVSLAVGGVVFSLGVSLRQAIVAAFVGVAISFLPLGLGTLASKWSGQPTMVVSRATFGLLGNIAPAVLAIITRVFWGAVLLWMLGASTSRLLVIGGAIDEARELLVTLTVIIVGVAVAFAVAFFGYALFARVQLVISILAGVLVIGLIAATWQSIDLSAALSVADGPWILVLTGTVLVFSFVGLAWANSSGDLARYQRPGGSGGAAMLWASFGSTLPAFILIGYGSLLAASSPTIATGLTDSPIDAVATLVPTWYLIPLLIVAGLSLLSGVIVTIYSGAFAVLAVGLRVQRPASTGIVAALVLVLAVVIATAVDGILPTFRDLATTLAVAVAAWAGIFSADMIIRRRRFDTRSLLVPGGIYPNVNWINLGGFIVATIIGLGLSSATVGWLGWEGFLFRLVGIPLSGDVATTDLGVVVALVLGVVTPLALGIRTVREQERAQFAA